MTLPRIAGSGKVIRRNPPRRPLCSACSSPRPTISTTPRKTGLETVSARVLALDGVLRRYGPDAKPARDTLKELITGSYTHVWQGDKGTLTTPTVEQAEERMDRLFVSLNALREAAPDSRKYLMAKAGDLATSINSQHLQISLQLSSDLSWPFMTILISFRRLRRSTVRRLRRRLGLLVVGFADRSRWSTRT